MTEGDSAQVLIAGAGPVGLLTALALAQVGVEVLVIEAEGQLNDSPRAAQAQAERLGARVRFGHKLVGLARSAGGIRAELETPHGSRAVRAEWLIGADGARSTVRELLGLRFAGHTSPNRFVATNIDCDMAAYGYQPSNFICDPVDGGVVAQLDGQGLWRLTYRESAADPAERAGIELERRASQLA